MERVTVTLPEEVVQGIDRLEKNRSRFISEAVRRELERRRREELEASLRAPHPESAMVAAEGQKEWAARLSSEEVSDLADLSAAKPIRWVPGKGWREGGA